MTTTTRPGPTLLVSCPSVRLLSNATARVLLVPWGEVVRTDGQVFRVDDATAAATLTYLSKLGRDLVIDYEHQSLGGEFAAPDGQAPAAGWIEQIESQPGRGIYGLVRWTPRAAQQIRDLEYRYLSPLVEVGPDGHAVRLLGAGLTNTPAIVEPEALTLANSRRLAGYTERNPMPATATLPNAFALPGQTTTSYGITDEVKRLLSLATTSDSDLMQMMDIVISMLEKAAGNNANREEVLMIGSAAMIAIRKYLIELQQNGQLQPNSARRQAAAEHFKSNLRLAVSMANAARQAATPSSSTTTPATPSVVSFTPAADPAKTAWSATVTPSYNQPAGSSAGAGVPLPNRTAAIALGQMEYRNAVRRGDTMICSERSFVDETLRTEKMAPLTPDEVRSHSVNEDPPRRSPQARRPASSPLANSATPADRARLIANSRAEYAGQSQSTRGVCSESSWVAQCLREAGLGPLTESERRQLPV